MRKVWITVGMAVALSAMPVASVAGEDGSLCVDGAVVAASAAGLVDAHVGGLLKMMEVLASTADLQVGLWGGMRDLLGRFEELAISFDAWFLLPDGSYYKVDGGLTGSNLSDRGYFPKVMAGEITLGDLVVSRSTGRKSMVMTVPIVREETIVGALGATVFLDDLGRLIADALALPEGIAFFAYAPDGSITLHANPERLLQDAAEAGFDRTGAAEAVSDLLGWKFVVEATDG